GVGDAQTVGQLEFSMLLSLDPDRMAQLGLTVSDVAAAVQEQNATNPAGRIGREPSPPGTQLTIPVVTAGRLTDPAEFGRIIVRGRPDGSLVRVNDIGEVRLGARNYDVVGRLDGKPTALFLVFLRPGANALPGKQAVRRRTLLALVLAIGIGVDDAIVGSENVERTMASEGVSPAVAADRAMRQVSRALIAIVLVLCSVFVPVAFLGGITGLMYRQFAITI